MKHCILLILISAWFSSVLSQTKTNNATSKISSVGNINGFIKNNGQIKSIEGSKVSSVLFSFTAANAEVYITNKGISYVYSHINYYDSVELKLKFQHKSKTGKKEYSKINHYSIERVDANLLNAVIDTNQMEIEYADNPARFSYYSSDTYIDTQRLIRKIVFKNVYPGIDWTVYDGSIKNNQKIKYDFIINKSGNYNDIKIKYSDNAKVSLSSNGELVINSKLGFIKEGIPVGYSMNNKNEKQKISYSINKENIVSYKMNRILIDKDYPYVFDPELFWGTYIQTTFTPYNGVNGNSLVSGGDITCDDNGNIFIVVICEGGQNFPLINPGNGAFYSNVYDSSNGADVYMKFNNKGVLLWSTFFGSGGFDWQQNLTIDNTGNLITVSLCASRKILPLKNNGGFIDSTQDKDSYIAKFDNNGILKWSTKWATYFLPNDIITDNQDNFYITGAGDYSPIYNHFPLKNPGNGALFDTTLINYQGFLTTICKFDKNCNLIWSTGIMSTTINIPPYSRFTIDENRNIYLLSCAGLIKFDSTLRRDTTIKNLAGEDITVDTSGNLFIADGNILGSSFPYVDPGNGAYQDPIKNGAKGGSSIIKYDKNFNLTWATTYASNFWCEFDRIVFDKKRNLIHLLGYFADWQLNGYPTQNDACNGSFYSGDTMILSGGCGIPILSSFTTQGKLLYLSFTKFRNDCNTNGNLAVDKDGNLLYLIGNINLLNYSTSSLKNPGNGAFFQDSLISYRNTNENQTLLLKLTPTFLNIDTSNILPTNCNCNGTLSVTPTCGSGHYSYIWNRGDTTAQIKNVCPGTYNVKVTDLNTNNFTITPFTIPNPSGNIKSSALMSTNSFCNKKDGTISVNNIAGGPSPYLYSLNGQSFSNIASFNSLDTGKYIITIKDADGCIINDTATINGIAGPKKIYTTISPTACDKNNGLIQIDSINSGTKPFSYLLNSNPIPTGIITGLSSNKYLITAIDSAGCSVSDSFAINKTIGPKYCKTILDNNTCGQITGAISITQVTGGTEPYQYSINNLNYTTDSIFKGITSGIQNIFVKDSNGCMLKDTVTMFFKPFPAIHLTPDTILCNRASLLLDMSQKNATYLWQDGTTSPKYLISDSGIYTVNVTLNSCTSKASIKVDYQQTPLASLPPDTTLCEDDTLKLNVYFPKSNYLWQDGSVSTIYYITNDGYYSCTISDYCGNYHKGFKVTTIKCYCDPIIPNSFSPNGDGYNDLFKPKLYCNPLFYHFEIFDRNGLIVFETYNPSESWNGSYNGLPAPIATYYYILKVKSNYSTVINEKSGSITLIR